jgi:hypothetical protein
MNVLICSVVLFVFLFFNLVACDAVLNEFLNELVVQTPRFARRINSINVKNPLASLGSPRFARRTALKV